MTPDRLYRTAIVPALAELSQLGIPSTPFSARFVLAIALQESNLAHRRQLSPGAREPLRDGVSGHQGELHRRRARPAPDPEGAGGGTAAGIGAPSKWPTHG